MAGVATYRVLGQEAVGSSWTTVYTVPTGQAAITSTVAFCYLGSTGAETYSLRVVPAGQTGDAKHQVVRGKLVSVEIDPDGGATGSDFYTLGLTLAAGDKVEAKSSAGSGVFAVHVYGTELS